MDSNALNSIVLQTAELIENASGIDLSNFDRQALNDKISQFLDDVGIDVDID